MIAAPLCLLGYGSDGDAWSVAGAATRMWQTGHYVKSRTTGFPLFEIIETPFVRFGGWYLSNLFVLACGMTMVAALLFLARRGHLSHPFLSVTTVAFLPVIIKNSTSTMDYVPALACLLLAYAAMLQSRWGLAATLIGVACGFRPTSGLFVVPLCVFLYIQQRSWALVLRTFGIALLCGLLAYSPAFLTYGLPNPYGSISLDVQTRLLIGGYNGLRLFGIPQTLVLLFVVVGIVWQQVRSRSAMPPLLLFHVVNVLVWLGLFVLLSDEPEYLLPIVPSVVFVLDKALDVRRFATVSMLLLSYHVVQLDVLGGQSGDREFHVAVRPGFTLEDIQDRVFKLSTREAATRHVVTEKTLLMFGTPWITAANPAWVSDSQYGLVRQATGNLYVSGRIRDEDRLKRLKSDGFRIVVWRGEMWEYLRTGNTYWHHYVEVVDDLSTFFGTPIRGVAINQR